MSAIPEEVIVGSRRRSSSSTEFHQHEQTSKNLWITVPSWGKGAATASASSCGLRSNAVGAGMITGLVIKYFR